MILSRVVEQFMKIFCQTQVYTWRELCYRQLKGLPIGPRATSAIARVVMNKLDKGLCNRLEELQSVTEMIVRYIDNIRILRRLVAVVVIGKEGLEVE